MTYRYRPHPRLKQLQDRVPVNSLHLRGVVSDSLVTRVNGILGLRITQAVGTMWCAYVFAALALVSLPAAIKSHDPVTLVSWMSQTFLQLVLLSVIIVGQNIQAKASDKRAEETFKDAEAVLAEATEIQKHLLEQDDAIATIIEKLPPNPPT